MLIDTHCHLDFEDFDRDRDEVIDRAKSAGVGAIINVASSIEGTRRSIELARQYDIVYASIGVHPHEAKTVTDKVIDEFRDLASGRAHLSVPYNSKKVVAVGEVGLDYYRNLSPKDEQAAAFRRFIHLADELKLPLIIHSREAAEDTIEILKSENKGHVRGVMHCFSGDKDFLKKCLDLGLYISFTCNLTFKNAADLRETAKLVPTEKLLLETDAPFLAPQEFRGRRNEPAYLTALIGLWSGILGLSGEDIARITTHNANTLFRLEMAEKSKIAYKIRDSLYLNITNRCTNNCSFCIRNETSFVKGHNLLLDKEPSAGEVIAAVGDPKRYKEIVFCGYGEPTMRLDVVKTVSSELKKKGARIRLVTNGHGDLINERKIAGELAGIVDKISISLNTDTEERYNEECKPRFGIRTYKHILDFIKNCVEAGIETEVTCLDLPGVNVNKCEDIAKSLGAKFRLRKLGVTG